MRKLILVAVLSLLAMSCSNNDENPVEENTTTEGQTEFENLSGVSEKEIDLTLHRDRHNHVFLYHAVIEGYGTTSLGKIEVFYPNGVPNGYVTEFSGDTYDNPNLQVHKSAEKIVVTITNSVKNNIRLAELNIRTPNWGSKGVYYREKGGNFNSFKRVFHLKWVD